MGWFAVVPSFPLCRTPGQSHLADPQKKKLEAAEATFEQSGTLKALLEKSEANKAKNKREIQNKLVTA
jgi:hypothetical protein